MAHQSSPGKSSTLLNSVNVEAAIMESASARSQVQELTDFLAESRLELDQHRDLRLRFEQLARAVDRLRTNLLAAETRLGTTDEIISRQKIEMEEYLKLVQDQRTLLEQQQSRIMELNSLLLRFQPLRSSKIFSLAQRAQRKLIALKRRLSL